MARTTKGCKCCTMLNNRLKGRTGQSYRRSNWPMVSMGKGQTGQGCPWSKVKRVKSVHGQRSNESGVSMGQRVEICHKRWVGVGVNGGSMNSLVDFDLGALAGEVVHAHPEVGQSAPDAVVARLLEDGLHVHRELDPVAGHRLARRDHRQHGLLSQF